jgi:hypothetical protein
MVVTQENRYKQQRNKNEEILKINYQEERHLSQVMLLRMFS